MVEDSSSDRDPVEVLAEEFLERLRKGEHPSLTEYKERYPNLADDIEDVFPALAMMDEIDPSARELSEPATAEDTILPKLEQLGDYRIVREVGRGGMGVVYEAEQVSLGRHVALKVLPSSALPDSKHVRRFEREAKSAAKLHHTNIVPVFGVGTENDLHYYVMQFIQGLPLDEVIEELKKIRSQPTGAITAPVRVSQPDDSSRDAREQSVADVARSLITGQFAQTLIGESDLDAGSDVASPELAQTVTELNPQAGDTSSSRLSETFNLSGSFSGSAVRLGKSGVQSAQKKPLTYCESVASIGMQVADAMHYAHEQGILHRDIKPSNLLLDLRGTTWVTDFGLAKATDQQDITHTGDILGTLRYMPPEAFEGKTDARSDVYSLGLTLYELLAFQPAFGNRDRHQLVKQVTTEAAPRLDKLNPEVPRDLVTIVHKAIDRDAAHRYQTARELEEDLHRFLEDEPIKARRISLAERFARWSRRNKSLAASLAALATLILVVAVGSTIAAGYFRNISDRLTDAVSELQDNQERLIESEAREKQRADQMEDLAHARDIAEQEALDKADEALAARYEMALGAAFDALTTPGEYFHGRELLDDLRPRPGEEDRRGIEWHLLKSLPDTSGGRILANIRKSKKGGVCFSPDDSAVAVADGSGDILILNAETGAVLKRLVRHTGEAMKLSWAAAGNRLVSASYDAVRVWDVESERELWSLPGQRAFALSPDETRLAISTEDGQLQIRDTRNGELSEPIEGEVQSVADLDWSVEDQIALCSEDQVRLLNMETGEWRSLHAVPGESDSPPSWIAVRFSPSGNQVAAADFGPFGQSVSVWDLNSNAEPRMLPAFRAVVDVAWSHDGSGLATTSFVGRAVEIWDSATAERVQQLTGHSESVLGCSWSHDDRQVVSTSRDGTVRVWDRDPEVAAAKFAGNQGLVWDLAWSPDSRYFATAGSDRTVRIWDVRSPRKALLTFRGHESVVQGVDWHPGTNRLASWDSRRVVLIWEWDGGNDASVVAEIHDAIGSAGLAEVVWSPDGTQIATVGHTTDESFVRTYDVLTGRKLLEFPLDGAYSVSWQRDRQGNSLLAAAGNEDVTVWNVETAEVVRTWTAPNESYLRVALSPHGDRVAFSGTVSGVAFDDAAGSEPVLGILDLDTGVVRRLHGHDGFVMSITWTADGTRLLTAGRDGTAILWNAESGRQLVRFEAPDRVFLRAARISPDQMRIAVAGMMSHIQMLDATPSYVEELAPGLERGLTTRIEAEPTARDLVLRGRVLAKQGRWDEAAADFRQAAGFGEDDSVPSSWFETTWWVAGPYAEALDDPQPPEQTDPFLSIPAADEAAEGATWSAAPFTSSLDLGRLFDHQEHISAYAVTRLYATEPQEIGLLLGADDQVKVWCNDEVVHTRARDSHGIRDEEAIEIRLERGWNTLLVKVSNSEGAHGLFAKFSEDPRELAQVFDRHDQFEQALRWAGRALADSPDDAPLLYVRGRAALQIGQSDAATESFDRVIETVANSDAAYHRIAELYLEHGRSLQDVESAEAVASLDRARQLFEQLVHSEGATERDAAGLADVLLMTIPQPKWSVLEPVEVTSAGGATLTKLDDGSILAGGILPAQEVYTVIAHPAQKEITGIVLETLPDPTLPFRRSGRHPGTGNFLISDVTLAIRDDATRPEVHRVPIHQIASDFVGRPDAGSSWIQNILDHKRANHWTAWPDVEVSHRLVFEPAEPLRIPENGALQITINCGDRKYPQRALGRFRLSVSDSGTAFEQEQARLEQQAVVLAIANGWERLAVAYQLLGNVSERDALLVRRPEATWEVARYLARIGRRAEAIDLLSRADLPADNLAFLKKRGEFYLQLHDQEPAADEEFLKNAADDYYEIVRLNPADSNHWLKAAPLLVAVGDDRYRQLCEDALDRLSASGFNASEAIGVVERIVKICSILPQDDPIRTQATQILDEAIRRDSRDYVWAKMAAMVSDYRAERFDKAIQRGEECLEISRQNESGLTAYRNMRAFAYLIQAMSHHQLGDHEEAEQAFQNGLETVNDGLPQCPELGWWDTFISRALLKEADALINESSGTTTSE